LRLKGGLQLFPAPARWETLRAVRVRVLLPVTAVAMLFAPAIASGAFLHTVAPGESLSSIAALDGLSVSRLAAANGLAPNAQLTAGSTVSIPPQGNSAPIAAGPSVSSTSPGASPSPAAASREDYVVQPGDTLSAIAARAGTSVARLAAANAIDPRAVLPAGSVLTLSPGTAPSSAPTQAPAAGTSIVGRMTWFGGPHDPGARGVPASGLGWRTDGMSFYIIKLRLPRTPVADPLSMGPDAEHGTDRHRPSALDR